MITVRDERVNQRVGKSVECSKLCDMTHGSLSAVSKHVNDVSITLTDEVKSLTAIPPGSYVEAKVRHNVFRLTKYGH